MLGRQRYGKAGQWYQRRQQRAGARPNVDDRGSDSRWGEPLMRATSDGRGVVLGVQHERRAGRRNIQGQLGARDRESHRRNDRVGKRARSQRQQGGCGFLGGKHRRRARRGNHAGRVVYADHRSLVTATPPRDPGCALTTDATAKARRGHRGRFDTRDALGSDRHAVRQWTNYWWSIALRGPERAGPRRRCGRPARSCPRCSRCRAQPRWFRWARCVSPPASLPLGRACRRRIG